MSPIRCHSALSCASPLHLPPAAGLSTASREVSSAEGYWPDEADVRRKRLHRPLCPPMRNPAKSSKRVHCLRRWVEENSFGRECDRDLVFDASDLTRRRPDPTSSPLCSSCSSSSRVPQQPANPRASLVCSPLAGHGTPGSFTLIGPLAPRPHARPHAAHVLARRTVSLSSRTLRLAPSTSTQLTLKPLS